MCDLEATGVPSKFKLIRSAAAFGEDVTDLRVVRRTSHGGSGSWFALAELLKVEERGQFPDDPPKIKGVQILSVVVLRNPRDRTSRGGRSP